MHDLNFLVSYKIEHIHYNAKSLRAAVITKRQIELDINMEKAAEQIGISKATLSRIEKGNIPDIETLTKLCLWLNKEPNTFFIIQSKPFGDLPKNLP